MDDIRPEAGKCSGEKKDFHLQGTRPRDSAEKSGMRLGEPEACLEKVRRKRGDNLNAAVCEQVKIMWSLLAAMCMDQGDMYAPGIQLPCEIDDLPFCATWAECGDA